MKLIHLARFLGCVSLLVLSSPSFVHALGGLYKERPYCPQALTSIHEKASSRPTSRPRAVIFDLDDTLFYAGSRTLSLLRQFISLPEIRARFSETVKQVEQIALNDMLWDVDDMFRHNGVRDKAFVEAFKRNWADQFFSDQGTLLDDPIPGAVRYVQSLHAAGLTIIYVTGRFKTKMQKGTKIALARHGFPINTDRALLFCKPRQKEKDHVFKGPLFRKLAAEFEVIGTFENEPQNAVLYREAFPDAIVVLLDTARSNKPDDQVSPPKDFVIISDYLGLWPLPAPEPSQD